MSSQDDSQLDRPVPDWLLERLARGELSPERAAEVRRRLEAEGEAGVERLAALERSDQEILAAHPPAVVAVEIRRRAAVADAAAAQRAPRPARLALRPADAGGGGDGRDAAVCPGATGDAAARRRCAAAGGGSARGDRHQGPDPRWRCT